MPSIPAIHEEIYQSPSGTHQFITRFIIELQLMLRAEARGTTPPRVTAARPKAPPLGFAKIHIDAGISRAHARSAAAAVCRDESGNFMGSSALVITGITDVATVEAIACLQYSLGLKTDGEASDTDADKLAKFSHSLDQGRHVFHDLFCIPRHVDSEQ
ncbi:hypothetical protein VPH35_100353 [Triticum aestivum]